MTVVAIASADPQVLLGGYPGYAGYPLTYGSPLTYAYTPQVIMTCLPVSSAVSKSSEQLRCLKLQVKKKKSYRLRFIDNINFLLRLAHL